MIDYKTKPTLNPSLDVKGGKIFLTHPRWVEGLNFYNQKGRGNRAPTKIQKN
jgi:hypothetical protein